MQDLEVAEKKEIFCKYQNMITSGKNLLVSMWKVNISLHII